MTSVRSLLRDRRGVAAVEFALLLPVMIALYLGMAELVQAYQAQKKTTDVAATIGDLASQDTAVTDAALAGIFTAGEMVIQPFDKSGLRQRLASVSADKDGNIVVDWTSARNWTGGAAPTVPAGMLGPNESVIVSDVVYDYDSPLDFVLSGVTTIKQRGYYRPRLSAKVEKR